MLFDPGEALWVLPGLSVATDPCRGNAPGAAAVLEPGGCAGGGFRACLLCSLGALGAEHPCPLCPHVPELPPNRPHLPAVAMAVLRPAGTPSCPVNGGNSQSGIGDPPVSVSPRPRGVERWGMLGEVVAASPPRQHWGAPEQCPAALRPFREQLAPLWPGKQSPLSPLMWNQHLVWGGRKRSGRSAALDATCCSQRRA